MALGYLAFGLSNINLTLLDILTCLEFWTIFGGFNAYIHALGYKSSASLKTSHPYGFPYEKKSTSSIDENVKVGNGLFIVYRGSQLQG
jgi:hypothetical protein